MESGKIGVEVKKLNNLIKRRIIKSCIETNVDKMGAGGFVIGFIAESDKIVYQKDIEKEFKIRRSTATAILKRLENEGLLKRVGEVDDKRLKRISLTTKAIQLYEEFILHSKQVEDELSSVLTKCEREEFLKIINKLQLRLERND